MELTIKEVNEIEKKELSTEELAQHPAFFRAIDETNNITGAVCSIYFYCSNYPTGSLFVGVRKIEELPPHIKAIKDPCFENVFIL